MLELGVAVFLLGAVAYGSYEVINRPTAKEKESTESK